MPEGCYELAGTRIFECAADGAPVKSTGDALELISVARSNQASLLVIPAARLDDEFFRLRSGVAGGFLQKFVTYGLQLAIIGDISRHVNASTALRDFVYESNKGAHVWFLADTGELIAKLNHRAEQ